MIGESGCKICYFYRHVRYISAKIIIVYSASIFVGEWLQRQRHFWARPLHILSKCDVQYRLHCLVLTVNSLYNFTKGKTYLVNERWRLSTCLQHPCYDAGVYPCYQVSKIRTLIEIVTYIPWCNQWAKPMFDVIDDLSEMTNIFHMRTYTYLVICVKYYI